MSNFRQEAIVEEAVVDDRLLLQLASDGDIRSFRELYLRHVRAVYQYCFSICRSASGAEDATQEVWAALWRGRSKVQLATPSALPWLLVTARHKSLNHVAADARVRRSTASAADAVPARSDPADFALASELSARVQAAVDSLPALDREIFRLCIEEKESYKSASRRLGLGPAVVRNRLSRIRAKLRLNLNEYGA